MWEGINTRSGQARKFFSEEEVCYLGLQGTEENFHMEETYRKSDKQNGERRRASGEMW